MGFCRFGGGLGFSINMGVRVACNTRARRGGIHAIHKGKYGIIGSVTILEGGKLHMGDIPPSVEGSTEGTHEVGITHALEHGRKYWHYFS